MKSKQKGIINNGFTPANNELARKIIKDCGLSTYTVYIIILSHRNTKTNECFPKNDIIAEECSCSLGNIKKHLNKLYKFGYLIIKSGYVSHASNYYFPMEIDLSTNKSIYSEKELNYINKIERRTNKTLIEEVPAQDNNTPSLSGDFTPKGKYVDDDLFDEEIEENEDVNIDNSSAGSDIIDVFYSNVSNYFGVSDTTIKTNETIKLKLDTLAGFVEDDNVEKIIADIMKNNQKSFNNGLKGANITNDFKKCTYIISCVQNKIKDKKAKAEKEIEKLPVADDGFVDYMNDNYISLPNGDNLIKEEVIRRIKSSISKQEETTIFSIIFGVIGKNNKLNDCSLETLRKVVIKINEYYGREFLMDDRYEGIVQEDAEKFDFVSAEPKIKKYLVEDDDFLASLG